MTRTERTTARRTTAGRQIRRKRPTASATTGHEPRRDRTDSGQRKRHEKEDRRPPSRKLRGKPVMYRDKKRSPGIRQPEWPGSRTKTTISAHRPESARRQRIGRTKRTQSNSPRMVVTTVRHPAARDRLLCVLSAQKAGTICISSVSVTDGNHPTQRSYTRIPALFYIHRHDPQPAVSARSRFSPIRRTARVHSGGKVLLQDIEAMTSDHTTDQSKSNLLRIVPKPGSGRR